jgi:hypothetical protein
MANLLVSLILSHVKMVKDPQRAFPIRSENSLIVLLIYPFIFVRFFFLFFETGSYYVAQAGLELAMSSGWALAFHPPVFPSSTTPDLF